MRKVKQELRGNISFEKNGVSYETPIENLGNSLESLSLDSNELPRKKRFKLLNGPLVNNHLALIDMQHNGLKLNHIFHYQTHKQKKEMTKQYICLCENNIKDYLTKKYQVNDIRCHLDVNEVYDKDYTHLPISEAQQDLNKEELKELMKELKDYQPTSSFVGGMKHG